MSREHDSVLISRFWGGILFNVLIIVTLLDLLRIRFFVTMCCCCYLFSLFQLILMNVLMKITLKLSSRKVLWRFLVLEINNYLSENSRERKLRVFSLYYYLFEFPLLVPELKPCCSGPAQLGGPGETRWAANHLLTCSIASLHVPLSWVLSVCVSRLLLSGDAADVHLQDEPEHGPGPGPGEAVRGESAGARRHLMWCL